MQYRHPRFWLLPLLTWLPLACQFVEARPQSFRSPLAVQQLSLTSTSTLSGHFRTHSQMRSRFLQHSRDILVYLPPDYEQNPGKRYRHCDWLPSFLVPGYT